MLLVDQLYTPVPSNWRAPPRANGANPPPQLQKLPGTTAPSTPLHQPLSYPVASLSDATSNYVAINSRSLPGGALQAWVPEVSRKPRRDAENPPTAKSDLLICYPLRKEANQLTSPVFLMQPRRRRWSRYP